MGHGRKNNAPGFVEPIQERIVVYDTVSHRSYIGARMITNKARKAQREANDREHAKRQREDQLYAWVGDYPDDQFFHPLDQNTIKFLKNEFKKLLKEESDGYNDNYRWARCADEFEMRRFSHWASRGCCGFARAIVELKGVEFLIGFNFGH